MAAPKPLPVFADQTAASGLTHSFTGEWEFMVGGGAATFECSGDGKAEIFAAGGTAKAQLFRNDSEQGGPLAFTPIPSGLELDWVSGAYPLDIDADGNMDLAVLRVGDAVRVELDPTQLHLFDAQGQVRSGNPRAAQLLGVPVDVLTPNALPASFRQAVLQQAVPV